MFHRTASVRDGAKFHSCISTVVLFHSQWESITNEMLIPSVISDAIVAITIMMIQSRLDPVMSVVPSTDGFPWEERENPGQRGFLSVFNHSRGVIVRDSVRIILLWSWKAGHQWVFLPKDSCLCARRERTQTNQRGADRRVMIACSQGNRSWPRPIRRNLTSLSIESQSDSPRYSIEPTRDSRWGSYSPSYVMIHPFHLSNEVWLEFHARSIPS